MLLREMAEDDVRAGRPLLCAVAVKVGKKRGERRDPTKGPGSGFYRTAHRLDRAPGPGIDREFWETELEVTYRYWCGSLEARSRPRDRSDRAPTVLQVS